MSYIESSRQPYDADVDMLEDKMEVDDVYPIISNGCSGVTSGVQPLLSMAKETSISKSMNPSVMINSVDYYKCVFIDESCFNILPRRPIRGSSAKTRIPMPCNHIFMFLGGITGEEVVSLSARRMPRKSSSIKDKYVGFLEVLMKVLKENGMGGSVVLSSIRIKHSLAMIG
ncbi:hypothetical protein BDC45DRAFT_542380 [Circinella umbellata]|nr:hypothetical protein BDC45DRAFT_542380 [Circinella umbellata]